MHVNLFRQSADEFVTNFKDAADAVKAVFMRGDYVLIYGGCNMSCDYEPFQILTNSSMPSSSIVDRPIEWCTGCHRPVGSDRETIGKALADLKSADLAGDGEHLKPASGEVERRAFCRKRAQKDSCGRVRCSSARAPWRFQQGVGKAGSKDQHPRWAKRGFTVIYGFTSDQQGIRQ